MGRISLQQAAKWCGGYVAPKYADITFFGANNDSRKIEPGQLFVALQGARDGHDFIPMALEKGAAAVLCTHCDGDYPAIVVPDVRLALGDIARQERRRLNMKVVAVTGSVGKSTTKEMIAGVLSGTFRVGKSPVNHNNDIGLPMSILALPEDTQVAVLEMGMNHFREIAYLSSIASPDIAVIVNIGTMHIEHLGSVEGILQAKMEILEGMSEDGRLILNGDDPMLWGRRNQYRMNPVYFAVNNGEAEVRGSDVVQRDGALQFFVSYGGYHYRIEMMLEGKHYVTDALAAITVAQALGVTPAKIQENLSCFHNMSGRQEIFEARGCTIINDCYNAGPESMAAALEVLGSRPGRRIAVLGDMLELGVCTQAEHYRIGRIAVGKCDAILTYGPSGERVITGAITGGMSAGSVHAYSDRDELAKNLKRVAKPGDVILIKGSRGMHMELILEKFLSEET